MSIVVGPALCRRVRRPVAVEAAGYLDRSESEYGALLPMNMGVLLPMSWTVRRPTVEGPGGTGPPNTEGARHDRFLIEREIHGAEGLTQDDLAKIAQTSNDAVASLGVPYTWVTSYVAGDKIYCLHEAEDAETILEHARRGGFPANLVSVVANEFGPQTAELAAVQ